MNALQVIKALGPIDAKSIRRDSLLRGLVIVPLIVALAMRWIMPTILVQVDAVMPFAIMPVYRPLMGYVFLMLPPLLTGLVIGFLLLDQRDDRTLTALQVTPLSLSNYLAYRLSMPMALSVIMTLLAFPLTGLAGIGLPGLVVATLANAPQAPLFALLLAVFAENKVQGFALTKVSGVILLPPLLAYFVPSGWQLLFGLAPTYWPAKVFWLLEAGNPQWWIYLTVGLLYQALLLVALVRRFNRIMHR